MNTFDVHYDIPDAEWLKAVRRRNDPSAEPIYHLFYADVVIDLGGESLLGPPFNISVADLACGLATILRDGFPTRKREALFRQGDDSLEIRFAFDGDEVVVSSEGRTLRVNEENFIDGVRSFIRRFAREAWERVPDALNWKDLKILAAFAGPGDFQQTTN